MNFLLVLCILNSISLLQQNSSSRATQNSSVRFCSFRFVCSCKDSALWQSNSSTRVHLRTEFYLTSKKKFHEFSAYTMYPQLNFIITDFYQNSRTRLVELHRTLAFVSVRFVSFAAVKTQLSGKVIVLLESIYGRNFIL